MRLASQTRAKFLAYRLYERGKAPTSRCCPGDRLIAVLYSDMGEKGKFEPRIDKPIVRPVSNRFTIE
jgi:hypothetical protein